MHVPVPRWIAGIFDRPVATWSVVLLDEGSVVVPTILGDLNARIVRFRWAEDVAAFDAAMAEEGPNIPWDEVKAELGWS